MLLSYNSYNLQLCRRYQIDHKMPSQDTDFLTFTYQFSMTSSKKCMETLIEKQLCNISSFDIGIHRQSFIQTKK